MKNELTCPVVRDLLPSFVEGLTAQETNRAVEAHLAQCPACAALRADMAAPEAPAETAREVDYLKAVKHRNRRRVLLAVLLTALALAAGLAVKVFCIGTQAQEQGLAVLSARTDGAEVLHLDVASLWSGTAYHGWRQEREGERVDLWARQVIASPLFSSGEAQLEIPLDGVAEVYLCGRLVWQAGRAISQQALERYDARTDYVGDAPALGRLARALNLEALGAYTTQLQTSTRPYGWTVVFSDPYPEARARQLDETMESLLAPQMLALVGNLDQVSWTYSLERDGAGEMQTRTVTAAEAAATAGEADIKACAASPAAFQALCDALMG